MKTSTSLMIGMAPSLILRANSSAMQLFALPIRIAAYTGASIGLRRDQSRPAVRMHIPLRGLSHINLTQHRVMSLETWSLTRNPAKVDGGGGCAAARWAPVSELIRTRCRERRVPPATLLIHRTRHR